MLNTRQGRPADILGVVKREGSRINLPPPSSFSCLFSASGTLPSLRSRAAEGRVEAKLTGSGWLSGHHQTRKAVPTVVTPSCAWESVPCGPSPAPLRCILPSRCLNSSQVPLWEEGRHPNRLNLFALPGETKFHIQVKPF